MIAHQSKIALMAILFATSASHASTLFYGDFLSTNAGLTPAGSSPNWSHFPGTGWLTDGSSDFTSTTLTSPDFNVTTTGGVSASLDHYYQFETGFDFGVVEMSLNGGPFVGYDAYTSTSPGNPSAITSNITGPSATVGDTIAFRFNAMWDSSWNEGDPAWVLRSFLLEDGASVPPAEVNNTQSTAISLGDLTSSRRFETSATLPSGGTAWYSFTLSSPVSAFDFDQFMNVVLGPADNYASLDSQIALFASDGTLLASDDDSGVATFSAMSFGIGDGATIGGVDANDIGPTLSAGQNGSTLDAGTYYLVVAGYFSEFDDGFGVIGGSETGSYQLMMTVPEPTTLAAIAGVAILMLGRRRD